MNTLIADSINTQATSWHKSLRDIQELFFTTLHEASTRATASQGEVLASLTFPIKRYDAAHVFAGSQRAGLGDSFFWEHPATQHALVGIGATATIETSGTANCNDAADKWRAIMHDAVIASTPGMTAVYGSGPSFFGGFAFDPAHAHTDLWANFPDGLLVLPFALFSYAENQTSLTLNRVIGPTDNLEQCMQESTNLVVRLFTAIEATPPIREIISTNDKLHEQLLIEDIRPASDWMEQVAKTASEIRHGDYEKVVLARAVRVIPTAQASSDEPCEVATVLSRLRQSYPGAYIFAMQRGSRFFVGATPERLVQAQDGQIRTMALAGTAPRGSNAEEDERIGEELLLSKKNNIEHAVVAAQVRDALSMHCSEVQVSNKPELLKLRNVQHLKTPIMGKLLPDRCILDVMADLHPTPAVGGYPRTVALEVIRRVEQLDRGWYAGPLGWIGAGGHGEFAVALRSGLIMEHEAVLFAGCGIVADSDPQSEYIESCLKLQVMLRGLSGQD